MRTSKKSPSISTSKTSTLESKMKTSSALPATTHPWKILAIVFMILFVGIIVISIFRFNAFRPTFTSPTSAQIQTAKTIALNDLNLRGINATQLRMQPSDKIRSLEKKGDTVQQVLEISFYNQSIRHGYVIDVDTQKILVYSQIEFHDGLNHSINPPRGGFFDPQRP